MRPIAAMIMILGMFTVGLSDRALGQNIATTAPTTQKSVAVASDKAAKTYRVKVLVINFDPVLESRGKKKLHEYARWNDPHTLARDFIKSLRKATGNRLGHEIVRWVDVNDWPRRNDGFQYTDATWLADFERRPRVWPQDSLTWSKKEDQLDYRAILDRFEVEKQVKKGEIDQVWIFGYHYMGGVFFESRMAGQGAYWCNGPVIEGYACKPFIVYYFNYERDIGCMLENVGHAMENIMKHVYGRCDYQVPFEQMNTWERFTLYDKIAPGRAGCGNVHFAPNSEKDYDWGNVKTVTSTCRDWRNYPKLADRTTQVNCKAWGGGDMTKHHLWWFGLMPHVDGRDEANVLNDWWAYYTKPTYSVRGG